MNIRDQIQEALTQNKEVRESDLRLLETLKNDGDFPDLVADLEHGLLVNETVRKALNVNLSLQWQPIAELGNYEVSKDCPRIDVWCKPYTEDKLPDNYKQPYTKETCIKNTPAHDVSHKDDGTPKLFTNGYFEPTHFRMTEIIEGPIACTHNWVDATNKYVSGTDLCLDCGALRSQEIIK